MDSIKKPDIPFDCFQIDDGYQSEIADWLCASSKKFPSGMKSIADDIHSCGMIAGLRLAPFAQRKLLAKINSMFGNLLFISDNVSEYSAEQLEVLKDTFKQKNLDIISAQFIKKDVIEIIYSENNISSALCFNIRTGAIL